PKALRILEKAGVDNSPVAGDELPAGMSGRVTTPAKSRSIYELLRFAIASKRLIQFRYGGELRVVEPHDYGIHRNSVRLLVYQRHGTRRGRSAQGWRLVDVAKIVECSVLETPFQGSRGEAHHRHYSWDVLYARVA